MKQISVGDWIIIKAKMKYTTWYTEKPIRVISVDGSSLVVDYNFYPKTDMNGDYYNYILLEYVEYYPMRELKLKRILEEDD